MIHVTHAVPVNPPGEAPVTRQDVWRGLVLKADDALPFVPAMTWCEVTARASDDQFDRDVEFRGQTFSERITLQAPHRVIFTRTAGSVLGVIVNEIEGGDDDLSLRFTYALVVADAEPGSPAEADYAAGMTDDYLKAVEATLGAVRTMVGEQDAAPATR